MLAAARLLSPRRRSSITSAAMCRRCSRSGNASIDTFASIPSAALGSGKSRIPRDGWRSPSPASVSTATSSHSLGTQARCVITLVRRSGPTVSCADSSRRRQSAWMTSDDLDVFAGPVDCVDGRAQCRSHSLESWPISSSEPAGPHVPAA